MIFLVVSENSIDQITRVLVLKTQKMNKEAVILLRDKSNKKIKNKLANQLLKSIDIFFIRTLIVKTGRFGNNGNR